MYHACPTPQHQYITIQCAHTYEKYIPFLQYSTMHYKEQHCEEQYKILVYMYNGVCCISTVAARRIGLLKDGVGKVKVEVLK